MKGRDRKAQSMGVVMFGGSGQSPLSNAGVPSDPGNFHDLGSHRHPSAVRSIPPQHRGISLEPEGRSTCPSTS